MGTPSLEHQALLDLLGSQVDQEDQGLKVTEDIQVAQGPQVLLVCLVPRVHLVSQERRVTQVRLLLWMG